MAKKTKPEDELIDLNVEESISEDWIAKAKNLKKKVKEKRDAGEDNWYQVGKISGTIYNTTKMSQSKQDDIIHQANEELKKSEDALSEILNTYVDVKKWYLDNEKSDDPFYVDYNLLYSNVDLLMALSFSNEMKVIFTGTSEADYQNSDIITKTAEYDYREEMNMDLVEYEMGMDKFLFGLSVVIFDSWNWETNSPVPIVASIEHYRPDPLWRWHSEKYRFHWFFWKMTKQEMREAGFFNVEGVIGTTWNDDNTATNNDNGTNVNITDDQSDDENAYFVVYNHFTTLKNGRKALITLTNNWSLLNRYIVLDYKIGSKRVFPLAMDFRKPKKGFPFGIRPYDITHRKQRVLGLVLNLAVKQTVRASLGPHIVADEAAIKNKAQLSQLTEFPEVILVDTMNGTKKAGDIITEMQRSWVPQDNWLLEQRLKALNADESSIGPNQLGQSPAWDQTATEITENSTNANVRLSLTSRVSMIFQKDFWRKWFMMYQYHFPEDGYKQVVISREFGDKYMTFKKKYLEFSSDPHIKIVAKSEFETKSKRQFANHIVLHSYIEKFAWQAYIPIEIRLSLRKALRLLGYPEDEILSYIKESYEEMEAKQQLYLLNRNEKLDDLTADQIDEKHEDFLEVYKQAKECEATRLAVLDRLRMLKERKKKDVKAEKEQMMTVPTGNTRGMENQMTADMLNNQKWGAGLEDIVA